MFFGWGIVLLLLLPVIWANTCRNEVVQKGNFAPDFKNPTHFLNFTSFQQPSEHLEGPWINQTLTFKVRILDEAAKFVVHLTNGRTLGLNDEDFNCHIDTKFYQECPSVRSEPWCCYSYLEPKMLQEKAISCTGKPCRQSPFGRCRCSCLNHLMFHVIFESNTSAGGGKIILAASYRKQGYLQSDDVIVGELFNQKESSKMQLIKYKELWSSSSSSPVNTDVDVGLWLRYNQADDHALEVGLSGREAPQLKVHLWDFILDENAEGRTDDAGWLGSEVFNKSSIFRPAYFATDATHGHLISVYEDCTDVCSFAVDARAQSRQRMHRRLSVSKEAQVSHGRTFSKKL